MHSLSLSSFPLKSTSRCYYQPHWEKWLHRASCRNNMVYYIYVKMLPRGRGQNVIRKMVLKTKVINLKNTYSYCYTKYVYYFYIQQITWAVVFSIGHELIVTIVLLGSLTRNVVILWEFQDNRKWPTTFSSLLYYRGRTICRTEWRLQTLIPKTTTLTKKIILVFLFRENVRGVFAGLGIIRTSE